MSGHRSDATQPSTMFSQEHRLKQEKDIKALFQKGKSVFGLLLSIRVRRNRVGVTRFAVVMGTKVAKRAVVRNRVRRKIRGIILKHLTEIASGYDVAILPKKEAIGKKSQELEEELMRIFKQKTPLM